MDRLAVCDACRGVDIVFNLAGRLGQPRATKQEMRLANVSAVMTLLEACQESSVRQVIHCSTPGVVGMVGIAPECLPYRPAGTYERTKCDGERLALIYHRNGRVPVSVVRPDFVYGPGDLHKLRLFQAIKDGRFRIIGRGSSLLHPTYVEDAINGFLLVMNNPTAYGEILNIAGPQPVTVAELAGTIADALGVSLSRTRVPAFAAKLAALGTEAAAVVLRRQPILTRYQVNFFTRDHASDISKAQQMLGFEPQIALSEGIGRTVEWYRREGYLQ